MIFLLLLFVSLVNASCPVANSTEFVLPPISPPLGSPPLPSIKAFYYFKTKMEKYLASFGLELIVDNREDEFDLNVTKDILNEYEKLPEEVKGNFEMNWNRLIGTTQRTKGEEYPQYIEGMTKQESDLFEDKMPNPPLFSYTKG